VVGEYTLRTSHLGTLRLNAAYSYNQTAITHVIANPAALTGLSVTLFGRQAQQDLLVATPHSKVVTSADWSLGKLHSLLRVTRYGRYTESSNVTSGDRSFGAKAITDLELGYDLTRSVNVAVGANNLFDIYPDKNGIIASDGSGQYGNFAPFGLSGGFYYARVGIKF
jgi:iron complex outermembrane receptor protein